MYEPSLVALYLEVCSDALQGVQKSGTQTIAGPLRMALARLVRQLNKIELGGAAGAIRANPAGKAAQRSKG